MPFVINGIGTWYYGRKHIHVHNGTCQFCGAAGALSSFDTTLFIVVVFIPVIPIGRKRILEECPYCRKHRVLSLSQWEKAKEADVGGVLDRLRRDPKNREAFGLAIAYATSYQDEPLLNQIVESSAGAHRKDAALQAQLGDSYAYFARWRQAEQAYDASLEVEENEKVREALAWTLLKQGRPQEAKSYLKHILYDRKKESAWLIFYLINGYQAEGHHDEALGIMDARDKAFPDLANLKENQQQRKTYARYRGTQKRISSASLVEGGTGYREGNWTARLPWVIAAVVVIGAIASYLGTALWLGQARKVFFVNGTTKPYSVSIQGQEHTLRPGLATPIRVAEGDVETAFTDAKLGIAPLHAHIETNFWTRPFTSPVFVINPDQSAWIVQELMHYAQHNPPPGRMIATHFGKSFYDFPGMDFAFEEFPPTQQVQQNQVVTKTRVALGPVLTDDGRLNLILAHVPDPEQVAFSERLLRIDPGNALIIYWLSIKLAPGPMLDILKTRLDDRPFLVDWHRAYQAQMDRAAPGTDLRPRYRDLVAETNGHPDAIYLLASIEPEPAVSEKLYRQAAAAEPPSGFAVYALGYQALSRGEFAEATVSLEKAMKLLSGKTYVRKVYRDALLGAKNYDRLLTELQWEAQVPGSKLGAMTEIARLHTIRGENKEARATIAAAVQISSPEHQQAYRTSLECSLCCWENDIDGFLKDPSGTTTIEAAILRGQLDLAAGMIPAQLKQDAPLYHGLIYLEAKRRGNEDRADIHWKELLATLNQGGRNERYFAAGLALQPLPPDFTWQRTVIDLRSKRVLLAVLAQRNPDQSADILALARKLDFYRDGVSLCLRKAWENPAN